jgi:DNA-binding NtrC family response regulator
MAKKVLVVDDEKLIRWSLRQKFSEWNLETIEAGDGKTALKKIEDELFDLVMLDIRLPDKKGTILLKEIKKIRPDLPVVMITAYGVIDDVVEAMRSGAYDFITKPIDNTKLQSTIKNAMETAALKEEIAFLKEKEKKKFDLHQIVANSKIMNQIMEMVKKIAQSEASIILLQGESGTGKDLLAQAIHELSRRNQGSFLAINCSAIPENLLESELFGYEKGAFTDAKHQKKGVVELANKGTPFLDESSTLDIHLQAKLLRFLETHTFKRVGGLKDIDVDIRVITATNQNLDLAVKEGKFRQDLLYRLNVCPINIPPLRERKEDIISLAQHFISEQNIRFRKRIKGLDPASQRLLFDYNWPGNVRELRNAIERAMIFEEGSLITPDHLPIHLNHDTPLSSTELKEDFTDHDLSLEAMEKTFLLDALKKAYGNKTQAAKLLKISRDTLRYRIKKFKIIPEDIATK